MIEIDMRRYVVFVIAAAAILLLSVGVVINPALATLEEEVEEQNKDNNVMLKIGQMLMTGNHTNSTPVLWYQNSSWLNGLEK